jgi:hypothetical protein
MNEINLEVIQDFENIIRYPIESFLKKVEFFSNNNYPEIINFYNGQGVSSNLGQSFSNLDYLINEIKRVFNSIEINRNLLKNFKWRLIIEHIENIENFLLSANNASRWLRSNITRTAFEAGTQLSVPLRQNQTIESIAADYVDSNNFDNDWVKIAINNELNEEDYTTEGGIVIDVSLNSNQTRSSFNIEAIVDNPQGEKILGIDIKKKLTYVNDSNNFGDFEVLSPRDSFLQSALILMELRKRGNPEFPQDGLNKNLTAGNNLNSISYPTIFRQLTATFKTDDTFKNLTLDELKREQDALYMTFKFESRKGDLEKLTLRI